MLSRTFNQPFHCRLTCPRRSWVFGMIQHASLMNALRVRCSSSLVFSAGGRYLALKFYNKNQEICEKRIVFDRIDVF